MRFSEAKRKIEEFRGNDCYDILSGINMGLEEISIKDPYWSFHKEQFMSHWRQIKKKGEKVRKDVNLLEEWVNLSRPNPYMYSPNAVKLDSLLKVKLFENGFLWGSLSSLVGSWFYYPEAFPLATLSLVGGIVVSTGLSTARDLLKEDKTALDYASDLRDFKKKYNGIEFYFSTGSFKWFQSNLNEYTEGVRPFLNSPFFDSGKKSKEVLMNGYIDLELLRKNAGEIINTIDAHKKRTKYFR